MTRRRISSFILIALLTFAVVFLFYQRIELRNNKSVEEPPKDKQGYEEELYAVRDNGRYGYIDKSGFIIIKPQFEDAYNFSEDLARVGVRHKYGFIDKTGKVVIEPIYEDASDFNEGLARVARGNRYGFIDKSGKAVIPLQYEVVGEFSEGLAGIYVQGKWGFINNKGEIVIQPRFDYVSFFKEGLAAVSENELYGYIDKKGQYVIRPKFNYASSFSEGLAEIGINNKYGYIDTKGNVAIELKYQSGFDFNEGLAAVMQDSKWGFINKKGKFIVKPAFKSADSFSEGRAAVYDGKFWGYIDKEGNMAIQPQYSYADRFYKELATVRVDDVLSMVDSQGKLIWHEAEKIEIQGPEGVIGTLIKMKIKSDKYDLMIKYPHAANMKDKELQNRINEILMKQSGTDYLGQLKETYRQDYDVLLNKNGFMSILNSSYMYMEGAAHGMSMRSSINIDMTTGRIYSLKELFKPGIDYKTKLNSIIKNQIIEKDIPLLREFEGINEKQEYYLTDKELVVYYQLYDYTPYAYGFLEFYIPYEMLGGLIDKQGPIEQIME